MASTSPSWAQPALLTPRPSRENFAFCDVNVTLTHPGVNDKVQMNIWLLLANWTGRYQVIGGGGYRAGVDYTYLGYAAANGFAVGRTDGGNGTDDGQTVKSDQVLQNGQVDLGLFADFSSRAYHDPAVVGKAVTTGFYGKAPHHSYWGGCSTGGRQGHMMVQKPTAPAINWPVLLPSMHWPKLVMDEANHYPSVCEFQFMKNASITACDYLDGVEDGVIEDPYNRSFDPQDVVGQKATCDGEVLIITKKTAELAQKIHDGPTSASGKSLWKSIAWGSEYSLVIALGGIGINSPLPNTWITKFLENSTGTTISRDLCRYPLKSEYDGRQDAFIANTALLAFSLT
ncbi:tannase and feruloyl esterase-domain-containing protein [Aspergillus crustosus]